MLLALLLAAVPGSGVVSGAIFATFTIVFMAVIAGTAYVGYRQNRLAWLTMPERDRMIFVGALGAIVYVVCGSQVITDWPGGVLLLLGVLGLAGYAIFSVVMRARAM
jgi:hypothetical protein